MFFRSVRAVSLLTLCVFVSCWPEIAWAQDPTGIEQLRTEIGLDLVNGSGVIVGQGEASNGENYVPDVSLPDFAGKTFWDGTGDSNGSSSGHTTSMAKTFYGSITGYAGGATDITSYDANSWILDVVNYASGGDPLRSENNDPAGSNPNPQTLEVINHSWIARVNNDIPNSVWTNVSQRVDFMVNRDNTTICAGTDNSGVTPPLLAHGYNAIIVGKTPGQATGPTFFYGSGRYKPEIVAPASTTSTATAITSGCAAILKQNSRGTNAEQNEVIKAILLAGATKEEFPNWDRTMTRPYDEVFGCGEVNIYNSYMILRNDEFDGSTSRPGTPSGHYGWDYSPSIDTEKFYSFDVPSGIVKASIVLTWNMDITDNNASAAVFAPSQNLANMDLELYDSSGNLIDSSVSAEHNIEHIYVQNLVGGQYTLRVVSDQDHDFGLAWRIEAIPVPDPTLPQQYAVTQGQYVSGDETDLAESDDMDLSLRRLNGDLQSRTEFEVKGVSPTVAPGSFEFTLEGSVFARGNVVQTIELFDYVAGAWELVDSTDAARAPAPDSVVTATPTGDLSRFVEAGTMCIEARIRFKSDANRQRFASNTDQAVWTILE